MALTHYSLFVVVAVIVLMLAVLLAVILKKKHQHQPAPVLSSPQPPPARFKDVTVRAGFSPEVVLHVAGSLAQASEMPAFQAIVCEVKERKVPIKTVEEFRALAGYGITGLVDGRIIALGTDVLMSELGIDIKINAADFAASQSAGTLIIYISINSYLAGIITIAT